MNKFSNLEADAKVALINYIRLDDELKGFRATYGSKLSSENLTAYSDLQSRVDRAKVLYERAQQRLAEARSLVSA